ncbi:MAG: ATP-binding domain-containing protein [Fibrobacteria bacterium]|nr:ATP-binding domain-containing protein [Fibrobacteria bacterium]
MHYMYRNTKEIAGFAARFIGNSRETFPGEEHGQQELFDYYRPLSGPAPELKPAGSFDELLAYLADQLKRVMDKYDIPRSQIAVLYTRDTLPSNKEQRVPLLIKEQLESKGVLARWSTENRETKKNYDISTNAVTISTIHSAKGLDYACVFLIGLEWLRPGGWSREQIDRLVYVAITRARTHLFIPYTEETELIKRLKG